MEQLVTALLVLVVLAPLAYFWWSMFSHLMNNPNPRALSRTSWLIAFVAFNVFGAALYFFYEYRRR